MAIGGYQTFLLAVLKVGCVNPRSKKLVGTLLMIVWIPVYALTAMAIGLHVLPHANGAVTFLYYLLAGLLWIVPVGLLLPWMHRERAR